MRNLLRLAIGAAYIVIAASALGFTVNALRPEGLPVIRKSIRETRKPVTMQQVKSNMPLAVPVEPAVPQPKPKPEADGGGKKANEPPKTVIPNHTKPQPPAPKPNTSGHAPKQPTANPAPKPAPAKQEAGFVDSIQSAKSYFDNRSALFLDARPPEDYEAGHIAGAVSLYAEKLDELYDRVLRKTPKDQLIITYCSDPECKSGLKLADALVARGFTRVLIFLEGLPAWKKTGYPTASGKEPGR